jgi:glucan biosynthesis protein C
MVLYFIIVPLPHGHDVQQLGGKFYIRGPAIGTFSAFIIVTWPWFMPLLFVLAGISTHYSLQRRTVKEYIHERFYKLLVPLFFGVLLLVPVQTFFAERFHNGYSGNYFQQYVLFFTKFNDMTGYTGGFTVGHLWFILYLFIISLLALPILQRYEKSQKKLEQVHFTFPGLIPLFIIPLVAGPLLDIGGKSLGKYFVLFLLGYFILSREKTMEQLESYRWVLFVSTISLLIVKIALYNFGYTAGLLIDLYDNFYMWIAIMMFLGIGKHCFNFRNKATAYLSKASFPIYIIHQSCIVATGYYVFHVTGTPAIQFLLIMIISIIETFSLYELFKRFHVFRFMFAIKK